MKTITAKFPGTCSSCGGRFEAGATILWAKGAPSKHTECPGAGATDASAGAPAGAGTFSKLYSDAKGAIPSDVFVPESPAPVAIDTIPARAFSLDADQQTVCDHRVGEAIAAAAAGSGKSTVIVERTAELVREGCAPEAILILTYNRTAGISLREKLTARMGAAVAGRVRALTYHAYCLALLRKWSPEDPRWSAIIGASDEAPRKEQIFGQILRQQNIGGEASDWATTDERVRESGIDPEAADAVDLIAASRWADGSVAHASKILGVMLAYAQGKHERGLVDFTDLLTLVAAEFTLDTERAKRAACFEHVMVDEAQDTNSIQQGIARYLGAAAKSVQWVGDLRQSIYGFRGAAPELLTDRVAAGAALLPIRTCRRSTAEIVEAGNAIARGRSWHLGGDSLPRPDAPVGKKPLALEAGAAYAASEIVSHIAGGGSPAEFAILGRTNATLPDVEIALTARGLPVRNLRSRGGVWETQVGQAIRLYLHAAEGRADDKLTKIANRPLRYLKSETVVAAVTEHGRGRDLLSALRAQRDRGAARLLTDLERLATSTYNERCTQIADLLVTDAEERAAGVGQEADDDKIEVIRALCRSAVELKSVKAIEDQVAKLKKVDDNTPAVTIGTCHASKGLEWDRVYVVACDDGMFPHKKAEDVEEERRLFYVATTRAKLVLTYLVGEEPSPFLKEMRDAVVRTWEKRPGGPGGGGGRPEATGEAQAEQASQYLCSDCDYGGNHSFTPDVEYDATNPPLNCEFCGQTPDEVMAEQTHLARMAGGARPDHMAEARVLAGGDGAAPYAVEKLAEILASEDPLAGPTPDGGTDAAPAPGSKYVPVRIAAVRALLEPLGFTGHHGRGQYVFTKVLDNDSDVEIRVYTTIPTGDIVSREAGEDSIRVVLIYTGGVEEKAVLPREAWVCRTAGWRDGIVDRVEKVTRAYAALPLCPDCGAPMRRRDGKRGSFFGCVTYPACRGTREVPAEGAVA